jgi:hypothetical protein
VALVDKEFVEAKLFSAGFNGIGHQVGSGGGDKSRSLHLYFQSVLNDGTGWAWPERGRTCRADLR